MPEKIVDALWITTQAARARGIILVHVKRHEALPDDKMRTLLADYGVVLSENEWVSVKAQLIADGVLEPVP